MTSLHTGPPRPCMRCASTSALVHTCLQHLLRQDNWPCQRKGHHRRVHQRISLLRRRHQLPPELLQRAQQRHQPTKHSFLQRCQGSLALLFVCRAVKAGSECRGCLTQGKALCLNTTEKVQRDESDIGVDSGMLTTSRQARCSAGQANPPAERIH